LSLFENERHIIMDFFSYDGESCVERREREQQQHQNRARRIVIIVNKAFRVTIGVLIFIILLISSFISLFSLFTEDLILKVISNKTNISNSNSNSTSNGNNSTTAFDHIV